MRAKPLEFYVCDALLLNPEEIQQDSLQVTFQAGQAFVTWTGMRYVPVEELEEAMAEGRRRHAAAVEAAKMDPDETTELPF